jgi:hypothetical protein
MSLQQRGLYFKLDTILNSKSCDFLQMLYIIPHKTQQSLICKKIIDKVSKWGL